MTGTRPSILSGSCAGARELSQAHVRSEAPSRGSRSRQRQGFGGLANQGKGETKRLLQGGGTGFGEAPGGIPAIEATPEGRS